jgi:hypothetical protein
MKVARKRHKRIEEEEPRESCPERRNSNEKVLQKVMKTFHPIVISSPVIIQDATLCVFNVHRRRRINHIYTYTYTTCVVHLAHLISFYSSLHTYSIHICLLLFIPPCSCSTECWQTLRSFPDKPDQKPCTFIFLSPVLGEEIVFSRISGISRDAKTDKQSVSRCDLIRCSYQVV